MSLIVDPDMGFSMPVDTFEAGARVQVGTLTGTVLNTAGVVILTAARR